MPLEAALKLAEDKELDLIEISPTTTPPVARIINFDKFRYQKERELKKQKGGKRTDELKQVRISVRAAQNDLKVKAQKIDEFLDKGHKAEIILRLRGREKYNKDWARYKLEEFLKLITAEYKIILEPRFSGQGLIMQIVKR
jgi:translation initiation factor IF-3